MKKSKKNSKKNLIISIFVITLIIVGLFVMFSGNDSTNSKKDVTLNCSFTKNLNIMNIIVNSKVNYENDIFKSVEEMYEIELVDEKLLQNIDKIKDAYDEEFSKKISQNVANYSIEKSQDSVIIKLNIDAQSYENLTKESKELVGDVSINYSHYSYGSNSLHEHIKSLGGECEYE